MFQKAVDGDFYNLDKAVKLSIERDGRKCVTFSVQVRLGENKYDTYLCKEFDNIKIPDFLTKIDSNLYLNFNQIYRIRFFEYYAYLTSNTKKKIGRKFINYNIKITGKNEEIKKLLEGEDMWLNVRNNLYNTDKITNIFLDYENGRVIFNFVNSSTNKTNIEDIKPEYEIEFLEKEEIDTLKNALLKKDNYVLIENKLVNINNVYNVKILPSPDRKVLFLNFVSNVTKYKDGQKIISTEFVKFETSDDNEFNEIIKKIIKE